jgi:hypothetical protein
MLGFGSLGQLALGEAGGLRQDPININRGGGYRCSQKRPRRARAGEDECAIRASRGRGEMAQTGTLMARETGAPQSPRRRDQSATTPCGHW